jgi:hypothetical protein
MGLPLVIFRFGSRIVVRLDFVIDLHNGAVAELEDT